MTEYIHGWKKRNWQLSSGGPVKNKEDFQRLDALIDDIEIKWVSLLLLNLGIIITSALLLWSKLSQRVHISQNIRRSCFLVFLSKGIAVLLFGKMLIGLYGFEIFESIQNKSNILVSVDQLWPINLESGKNSS